MKIKFLSSLALVAALALSSCKPEGYTYEQYITNSTDEVITVSTGSGQCEEHVYTLNPGQTQKVHSSRVLDAPTSCNDHHYMVMSGQTNLNDISDQSNWTRTQDKDQVKCEFVFRASGTVDPAPAQKTCEH